MAEEAHLIHPPEAAQPPPATAEETQTPPPQQSEPIPEPPLASLSLDEAPPPAAAATVEEHPKESPVTIVERDSPLPPPPPESPTATATVTLTTTQPLAAALSVPQESEEVTETETKTKPPPQSLGSFKEESNRISDLSQSELKSLHEFKNQIAAAEFGDEASIWGVPLLKDDRSDVVLLKFLRARDFKVKESLSMLKNTLKWRKDFGVDELLKEDLGDDLEKVVFMHGCDKEGHPVCYNVYGEFQNKELYAKTFGDEEKRQRFLRWRIQFLERSIRKLDFNPGGINTIFQISDLKNSPGPGKKELRIATKQALLILQDNYPEFVTKQVFINVPWWYLAFYTMMSPFLTQRTKSKFVFASPSKTPETLFKYITPEQVPTQYGGLSVDFCECNPEFTVEDPATEITIKPATKQIVEIIVNEKCTLCWELRVVGWEVRYGAEYVPNDERGYTVIVHKTRKMLPTDEPVVLGSFNVTELGKIFLTVDNTTTKKKKLVYRFKVL
ncbi:patellin-3-like [Salvia miltiorrhiza]|uniref:patellin-3-like n=1 Tax=Salvia miltiorrhiza TaxID=226208 RepID=UPI0025AC6B9A|nr:patellin-3-like [Salvia miltiorrhiza]